MLTREEKDKIRGDREQFRFGRQLRWMKRDERYMNVILRREGLREYHAFGKDGAFTGYQEYFRALEETEYAIGNPSRPSPEYLRFQKLVFKYRHTNLSDDFIEQHATQLSAFLSSFPLASTEDRVTFATGLMKNKQTINSRRF